ncbi:MAG: hypothetical protein ACM3L9_10130 [Deltaproteobacteria bacterium]
MTGAVIAQRTVQQHVLKRALLAFVSSAGLFVAGLASADKKPVAMLPEPAALMILIRSTIAALNHANLTNNYFTFRDLGTAEFQRTTSPEKLSQQLKPFRDQGLDLSPVFAVTPVLDQPPVLARDGTLELAGHFPTSPLKITFRLAFQNVNQRWRHSAVVVGAEPVSAR